jgi:hypothetical protein
MGLEDAEGVDFSMWPVREVSEAETEGSVAAEELLQRITERSGLAEVTAAVNEFYAAVKAAETSGGAGSRESLPRMERTFGGWLSAFRAFDDKTKAWLSRAYGKDSPAYQAFTTTLSEEFDGDFAYRLVCSLRNAATHVDRVINAASFQSREVKGMEEPLTNVVLEVDPARLAQDFPKMRAATRDELAGADRNLDLRKVVYGVMGSCERAHAVLFDTLWPQLDEAVILVEGFHAEAVATPPPEASRTGAFFVPTETLSRLPEMTGLSIRQNPIMEAWLTRRNRTEVDKVLRRGPAPGMIWEDYTRSGPDGIYDRMAP